MPDVVTPSHLDQSMKLKRILATYAENEDLITVGAYVRGTSPEIDTAIAMREPINEFLRQRMDDHTPFGETCKLLSDLVDRSQQITRAPVIPQPTPPRVPR